MSEHNENFAQRVLRETTRFAVVQFLSSVLSWAAYLALARLLDRRDFGVYGICSFYVGLGALLGDGGLGATLLRRKEEITERELRAALALVLSVGATLATALFFAAPWIGARNGFTAQEIWVLRAMAPLYLLSGLRLVPYLRLERGLFFSQIARVEIYASITRHVAAITLAALSGGVWALVASNVLGAVTQCVLAYVASPGWVAPRWSWNIVQPLLRYGAQVQALGLVGYLKDNVSRALLGATLGPAAVGVFDFGQQYIQVPVAAVNSLARVQLPVYARLEARDPQLYDAVRGAMRVAFIAGIPALGGLAFAAPFLVPLLYHPRWAAAYPVIWGLLGNMIGGLLASPLFTLFQGQGRAGMALGVFSFWTTATWILALLAVHFYPGNLGLVAGAYSAVTVTVVFWMLGQAGKLLGRNLIPALAAPVLAALAGIAAGWFLPPNAPWWLLHPIGRALLFVSTYATLLLVLEGERIAQEFRSLFNASRRS